MTPHTPKSLREVESMRPNVCPVCEGRKVRYDHDTLTWGPLPCIACKGTGIGPVGRDQTDAARQKARESMARARELRRQNPRGWTAAEDRFILASSDQIASERPGRNRPRNWFEWLADELLRAFPQKPRRTVVSLRARILRLETNRRKGNSHA